MGTPLKEAPWFRLDNYECVSDWKLTEWFVALSARHHVKHALDSIEAGNVHVDWRPHLLTHFDALSSDVLHGGGGLWSPPGQASSLWVARALKEGSNPDATLMERPVEEIEESVGDIEYWRRVWPKERARFLAVDLGASDAALVKAFGSWLEQQRGSQRRTGGVTSADLKQWTQACVLPYLDLSQYLRLMGLDVAQHRLADALFPEELVDVVERLRKVTMKHYRRIILPETLTIIAAQLSTELPRDTFDSSGDDDELI